MLAFCDQDKSLSCVVRGLIMVCEVGERVGRIHVFRTAQITIDFAHICQ